MGVVKQVHKLKKKKPNKQTWAEGQRKQGMAAGTDSWEEMQEGPSEDAEPLERPDEALDRVETVDMRRSVEDRM